LKFLAGLGILKREPIRQPAKKVSERLNNFTEVKLRSAQ